MVNAASTIMSNSNLYIIQQKFIGDFPLVISWLLLLLVFDAVCFTTPSGSVYFHTKCYISWIYHSEYIHIFIYHKLTFISNIIFAEQIDKYEQMHMFVLRIEMNCIRFGQSKKKNCMFLLRLSGICTKCYDTAWDSFDFAVILLITLIYSLTNWIQVKKKETHTQNSLLITKCQNLILIWLYFLISNWQQRVHCISENTYKHIWLSSFDWFCRELIIYMTKNLYIRKKALKNKWYII